MGSGSSRYTKQQAITELFEAIQTRHFIRARQLIESGVPINCTNIYGATPLMQTCRCASVNEKGDARETFVRYLLKKECDLTIEDIYGMTAYLYALQKDSEQILRSLERKQIWTSLYKGNGKQDRTISINDYLILYDINEREEYQ